MVSGEIVATGEKTYVELGRKPKAVIAYHTGNLQLNWAWLENMGDKYIYGSRDTLKDMKYDSDFEVHSASPEMTITDTGFGISYPHLSAGATYYYYAIY